MRMLAGCAVALLIGLTPSTAAADAYVVRGEPGSFVIFDYEGDFFKLAGDGFSVSDSGAFGLFIPRVIDVCRFCRAGDIVDLSFRTPGTEVAIGAGDGRATIGGVSYTGLSYRGWLDFDAEPFLFPDVDTDFVRGSARFEFTGFLRGFLGEREVFAASFTGVGSAFIPYVPAGDGSYEWEEGRLDYWFRTPDPAPVPEPGTMLLIGTGLLALVRSRRTLFPPHE